MMMLWCLVVLLVGSNLLASLQALPLCVDNRHITGEWTKDLLLASTATKKAFTCCGRDNNDYLHNTTSCTLLPGTIPPTNASIDVVQGVDGQVPLVGYDACQCDRKDNKRSTLSAREKFIWDPSFCDIRAFDAVDFCRQLGSRTMLFAGDSSMLQVAESLLAMLQQGFQDLPFATETVVVPNCMHQITFHRTDLVTSTAQKSNRWDLFEVVRRLQPNVTVFSVGLHFNDLAPMVNVWQKLSTQLRIMKSIYPTMKLVWRSQFPNFVSCRELKASRPLSALPPQVFSAEQIPADRLPMVLDDFVQQQLLSTRNAQSDMLRVDYLDVSPLYLRPDALTSDCNHFCLPGPLNLVVTLLYNKLLTKEL